MVLRAMGKDLRIFYKEIIWKKNNFGENEVKMNYFDFLLYHLYDKSGN
jgi:hypothetical protein